MATSITFGQLCPDGTYRIRSAFKTDHYLELEEDPGYDVRPMPDSVSDFQKWQIKGNTDVNTYTITNVGGKLSLSFRPDKDENGNPISRINASIQGSAWTIEPRGPQWVIGYAENEGCVDYASQGGEDWLLLWDRNNGVNQRWIIEPVIMGATVTPEGGKIKVVNNSTITVYAFVSNWSNAVFGNRSWSELTSGESKSWDRGGNEVVVFSNNPKPDGTEPPSLTTAVFVPSKHVVHFTGLGHPGVFVSQ